MNTTLDLTGPWMLRWHDGQRGDPLARVLAPGADMSRAITAEVPGEVHLDLVRAGLLAEPVEGMNNLSARWVQEHRWFYRRGFRAPALAPGARAWLTFNRLELNAVVYLNGHEVGRHANAFHPCALDVTDHLREGENHIVVDIESGVIAAADRPSAGFGLAMDSLITKRNWLRTVQSSFGWDWAPQLLNVGITGGVRLEVGTLPHVLQVSVLPALSRDLAKGTVTARVRLCTAGDKPRAGFLRLEVPGGPVTVDKEVTLEPGETLQEITAGLDKPELWWPVGHGLQRRYEVRLKLEVDGALVLDMTRRVGFRHVRVNQDPHPTEGTWFVFEINGKPIFLKGGNYVPADPIPARIDGARYRTLVERALEARFNMLRIWGGGLYEDDALYDLCDERGLVVWQEFIFACAKYPAFDEAWLADVKREATWQVRRLAHHPSLIAWCGNNEMEEGTHNWGYEKGVAHPDYVVFHHVLPVILRREDGTRQYQPSSPFSPDHQDPRAWHTGDQHPWTVGFKNTDFRDYRAMTCRFPNEGGILGPTALGTVKTCLPPGQDRPGSAAWEARDNAVAFWGADPAYPDAMLEQWLGRKLKDMSIEDYVYWAGLVQGQGLAEYIRNFRRRMFDTSSAVFWMYNDCWPMVRSWTIVDYYLRRTPAFHPVRRAFLPLTVFLAVEDRKVLVIGVNEGPAWSGEARYGLVSLAGGYPVDRRGEVSLPANAATRIAEMDLEAWERLGVRTHAAFAILGKGEQEAGRDLLLLPFYREMAWPKAEVRVERTAGRATFRSDVFAWRVCLDLEGDLAWPDNFFDVLPGVPTVLDWPETLPPPRVLRLGNG